MKKWTLGNLSDGSWIKITIVRSKSTQNPLSVDIDRIKAYLKGANKDCMFHPQDYRYVVKFAVRDWDTAMMIKLMASNDAVVENVALRPEQIERQRASKA